MGHLLNHSGRQFLLPLPALLQYYGIFGIKADFSSFFFRHKDKDLSQGASQSMMHSGSHWLAANQEKCPYRDTEFSVLIARDIERG